MLSYNQQSNTSLFTKNPINKLVTFKFLGQFGRLGNQLFQIASTIGVARRNSCEYIFPPWRFAKYFHNPIPQSRTPILTQIDYYQKTFVYQPVIITQSTNLVGHYQSEKYFAHCAEEIRNLFAPHQLLSEHLMSRFGTLFNGKTCSVHIRRTDYVINQNYTDLSSQHYYEKALALFNEETNFLFFSDDIEWCKRRFQDKRFIFIEGLNEISDLFLMSCCQSHIIANSSFSWWGAWLNKAPDKTVIAPKAWFAGEFADPTSNFQPGPPHKGYHDTKDLLPEHWIQL